MIIIVAVLVGLSTVAAITRIFARLKLRVKLEMDDYLCFAGVLLLYGMLIELILCEYETASRKARLLTFVPRVHHWWQWDSLCGSRSRDNREFLEGTAFHLQTRIGCR